MARRGGNDGESVNLFPFLSILVCIIGCLTLIIVVVNMVAMQQAEGKTPEEVERSREYVKLRDQREAAQKQAEEARKRFDNLILENQEQVEKQKKLAQLKELLETSDVEKTREELVARINLAQQAKRKLANDEKTLAEEIKEKEEEIARRKLPPEAAKLQVRPTGSSTNTKPFFVELSSAGIYIHRSVSAEPEMIPVAMLNQSEEFIAFLREIAAQPYNRLIFLVRGTDQAVNTLNQATRVVTLFNQQNGTELVPGKLPLPNEGKVDLSVFAKFLEP